MDWTKTGLISVFYLSTLFDEVVDGNLKKGVFTANMYLISYQRLEVVCTDAHVTEKACKSQAELNVSSVS